jgi:hypothetical protein
MEAQMRAPKPNERVMQLAWQLERQLAMNVTAALEAINERLAHADGYPTQTIGASPPDATPARKLEGPCPNGDCRHHRPCPNHDGATLTPTERAADIHYRETAAREEIRDRIEGIVISVASLDAYLRTVIGRPHAEDITQPVPMCRDNQVGKHAVDEWGDPHCPMTADKGGLCQRHYLAWWRARDRDGINVRGDHEPAA